MRPVPFEPNDSCPWCQEQECEYFLGRPCPTSGQKHHYEGSKYAYSFYDEAIKQGLIGEAVIRQQPVYQWQAAPPLQEPFLGDNFEDEDQNDNEECNHCVCFNDGETCCDCGLQG